MMSRAAMLSEDEAQEQRDEAMVLFRRAAILRGDATSEVYLFPTLCCSFSDERIMYNLLCLLPPNLRRNRVAPSYVDLTLDAINDWNAQQRRSISGSRIPLGEKTLNSLSPGGVSCPDESDGLGPGKSSSSSHHKLSDDEDSSGQNSSKKNDRDFRQLFQFQTEAAFDSDGWKMFRVSPSE